MSIAKIFSFIKKSSNRKVKYPKEANIIKRSQHNISRKLISSNALKVLYRLHNAGFQVYLVGGCVRDLLLGREPKDFDVATNAKPNEIKKLFKNCRLIGRRFRLAHILFQQEIIEVSTFRGEHEDGDNKPTSKDGMLLRDNVYGNIVDDAKRRDFTINALYYNIADFSVIDFHNGLQDLEQGILRMIGEPETRYREDPVRMLRAVRLAAKLGFRIEPNTERPFADLRCLLQNIAPARLFTESLKLFLNDQALETFKQLRHYQLLEFLFPLTEKSLHENQFAYSNEFISILFTDTEQRIAKEKTVSPGYLIAALLWPAFFQEYSILKTSIEDPSIAFNIAYGNICAQQQATAAVPKHFLLTARTIWELQFRMENIRPNKCYNIVNHQRFRAAYDFLLLRVRAKEPLQKSFNWWDKFYHAPEPERLQMLAQLKKRKKPSKKRLKHDY